MGSSAELATSDQTIAGESDLGNTFNHDLKFRSRDSHIHKIVQKANEILGVIAS